MKAEAVQLLLARGQAQRMGVNPMEEACARATAMCPWGEAGLGYCESGFNTPS